VLFAFLPSPLAGGPARPPAAPAMAEYRLWRDKAEQEACEHYAGAWRLPPLPSALPRSRRAATRALAPSLPAPRSRRRRAAAPPLSLRADLFAIIQATEKLERAYVRDAVGAAEYEAACRRLLGQFKTIWAAVRDRVPDVERFMATFQMGCPLAATRLVRVGLPATVEHAAPGVGPASGAGANHGGGGDGGGGRAVAECTTHFITAMDGLKLGMTAVDQVCPVLSDLVQALGRVGSLPPDYAGRERLKEWYGRLFRLPASHELGEGEARQLAFELEAAFNEFMRAMR